MNSYGIGQFIGGVLGIAFFSFLLRFVFIKFFQGPQLVLATVCSAVAIGTFLYAFGNANGGPPQFGAGFSQYGVGGVIVGIVWLLTMRGRTNGNG